jgi:dTDP-4-amino-4,6-dideoxygalactose transaminase
VGVNFRLDAIQAAVLKVKLPHLDALTEGREAIARLFRERFAAVGLADLVMPHLVPGYRLIYYQFVIRVPRRDALREHLAQAGIGTEIYYPIPLHMQVCFAYLGYAPEDCPESAKAAADSLAVPIYPELEREQIQYVVDTIAAFYG